MLKMDTIILLWRSVITNELFQTMMNVGFNHQIFSWNFDCPYINKDAGIDLCTWADD